MSMITELPSSTTPGGKIIWTISDYNLTGVKTPNPAGDPVKICPGCSRHLPLTEFLVKEKKGELKGKEYMFLLEDGPLCRDCHPAKTDFTLYKVKGRLMMRIRELRQASGQLLDLWDPFAIGGWSEIQGRPTRLMDGTPNKVRMQPSNYRSYVDGQRVTPKKYSAAPGHKPKATKTKKSSKKESAKPERKLKSQDPKSEVAQMTTFDNSIEAIVVRGEDGALSSYGFQWGPMTVTRLASDPRWGVVLLVAGGGEEVRIRVTPKGHKLLVGCTRKVEVQ